MSGRLKSIAAPLSKSLLSQVIGSATNFALIIYLVRTTEQVQFGYFGVAYAVVVLFSGIFVGLIGLQYVVTVGEFNVSSPEKLLAGFLVVGAGVSVAFACLALLATVASTVSPRVSTVRDFILPILFACVTLGFNQSVVKFAFSIKRENLVLMNYLILATVLLSLLALNHALDLGIDASTALVYLAVSQGIGCLAITLKLRPRWADVDVVLLSSIAEKIWVGGKWAILSSVVYNVRSQAHNFLVSPLLGPVALAQVNAARLLVQPAMLAIPPFLNVFMPRLVNLKNSHPSRLYLSFVFVASGVAAISFLYTLILLLSLDYILIPVLGEEYANIHVLVFVWCAIFFLSSLRAVLTMINQVFKFFSKIMWANFLVGAILLQLAFVFINILGKNGAVMSLALAEMILLFLLVLFARAGFCEIEKLKRKECNDDA
jgi:O-antigen/teichoic acid export membrane protein